MDAVITYVNMNDPVWQKQYQETFHDEPNIKRFKELGTLELQVQLIRKYMSWIDQIFVVVSTKSQIKRLNNVTIITHDQIIPQEYLPTFSSCTIEMFLHKISNLSEYFIYFNDDIFPINYIDEKDFFDNLPILSFKTVNEPPVNIFRHQCKNSSNLARLVAGLVPSSTFIKPDHICLIHSKSAYEKVWSKLEKTILNSLSKRRESKNLNQYLFIDYLFYSNQCKIKRLNYAYLPYKNFSAEEIYDIITKQKCNLICIQDNVDDDIYDKLLIQGLTDNLKK